MNRIMRGLLRIGLIVSGGFLWGAIVAWSYSLWEYAPYFVIGIPPLIGLAWLLGKE